MKKVLAWVLALALVLSTFAMSFATYTDEAAQKEANCEGQVAVLSALGVVTGYPDGSFKPGNVVTRAEMAALVIRAMGFSDVQQTGYTTAYSDVAKEAWCSGVVKQATDLGLIKGYPDGTFKPNNTVTYFEAITMIVRSLGYSEEYLVGKWPQNYVNQGRTIDLYADITVKEENFQQGATRGDCAIMIYNTLEKDLVSYDKDGRETQLDSYDTYLNRLAKSLGGTVQRTEMVVQMCDIANSDLLDEDMLGAPITAWTFKSKDAKASDIPEVIAIESVNAEKYVVEGYDNGKIEIDGTKYSITSTTDYKFYNGYVLESDTWLNQVDGNADFTVWGKIDGKKIDVNSALEWEATKTIQWSKNDVKKLARGDFDEHYVCNKNEEIDTTHFFIYGADSLDKIEAGNIVTFYLGNPTYYDGKKYNRVHGGVTADSEYKWFEKSVSKVEVGTKTVEGTVDSENLTKGTVKIDGTVYDRAFPEYCVANFEDVKLAGKTGTAYLNYRGEVAAFDTAASKYFYGIYLDGKADVEYHYTTGMQKTDSFELFTAAGEDKWFPVNKKATISSDKAKSEKDQLVKYELNSDEEISVIDFKATWVNHKNAKIENGKLFDGSKWYPVSDDVVVFTRDAYKDGDWTVTDFADLDGVTLNPAVHGNSLTEYFVNADGIIEAIACDYCVADKAGQYLFIDSYEYNATGDDSGYYDITFAGVEGTFQTNENWFVAPNYKLQSAIDFGVLAYVEFESDGKIMTLWERDEMGMKKYSYFGMKLTAPKVFSKIVEYSDDQIWQGEQYIISGTTKYPVTGAKYYKKVAGKIEVASIDEFAAGDVAVLIQTTSEADNYDIVLINFQD